jgi:hypothetical protein
MGVMCWASRHTPPCRPVLSTLHAHACHTSLPHQRTDICRVAFCLCLSFLGRSRQLNLTLPLMRWMSRRPILKTCAAPPRTVTCSPYQHTDIWPMCPAACPGNHGNGTRPVLRTQQAHADLTSALTTCPAVCLSPRQSLQWNPILLLIHWRSRRPLPMTYAAPSRVS